MNRLRGHEFEADELMAYLDGELEAQRAAELVAHMNHCAECQALAKEFRQISERMLDFQVGSAPEKIGNAVRVAFAESGLELGKQKAKPRRVWSLQGIFAKPYRLAMAGIGVVAVVSLVVWMSSQMNRPNSIANWMEVRPSQREGLSAVPRSEIAAERSELNSARTSEAIRSLPVEGRSAFGRQEPPPSPPPANQKATSRASIPQQPMIARTASLTITPANYDQASSALENLAASHGGYVQEMSAQSEQSSSRSVSATLRVPAAQLNGTLSDLRNLGHVDEEKQENSEVTDQYVDMDARLKNARATEQRLIDLLATRTGKLDDVLDVERELASVRGNIESMDAQRTVLLRRVDYATVAVELEERYEERLNSDSTSPGARIRNALVAGVRYLMEGMLGGVQFLLTYGPSIVFWSLLILVPAWWVSRRYGWLGRR